MSRFAPSVYVLIPRSQAGQDWLDENIGQDAMSWGGGLVVEHRYLEAILEGMAADGLTPADIEVTS